MNKIKLARLQNNLTAKELYEPMGLDKSDFSKIENGKLLPNGRGAKVLLELTKSKSLNQLLDMKDIEIYSQFIRKGLQSQNNTSRERDFYKPTFRAPKGRCNLLQQPKELQRLGYKNLQDWFWKKYLETERERNELDQKEREYGRK